MSATEIRTTEIRWFFLCAALLAVSFAVFVGAAYYDLHWYYPLTDHFDRFARGDIWPGGMVVKDAAGDVEGVRFGGPLFFGAHYLLWRLGLPMRGFDVLQFLLGLGTLALWLRLSRHRFSDDVRYLAAVFIALDPAPVAFVGENSSMMFFLSVPLFFSFLGATEKPDWRAMLVPGVITGVAIQCHVITLFLLPALFIVIFLDRRFAASRAAAFAAAILVTGFLPAGGALFHGHGGAMPMAGNVALSGFLRLAGGQVWLSLLLCVSNPLCLPGSSGYGKARPNSRAKRGPWLCCGSLYPRSSCPFIFMKRLTARTTESSCPSKRSSRRTVLSGSRRPSGGASGGIRRAPSCCHFSPWSLFYRCSPSTTTTAKKRFPRRSAPADPLRLFFNECGGGFQNAPRAGRRGAGTAAEA
ncbi:MAG: glycosyltransferase family 39 protein [Deltaproteobacteria bacterium]|nr:glycosyltransferase family 39 protein [Deltaproteobacteria bacterium]